MERLARYRHGVESAGAVNRRDMVVTTRERYT